MHLAIVIDDERLEQEQSLLNRLCIGLIAEGVQVTRIVPDSIQQDRIDQGEQRIALATRVQTPLRVLPWMRRGRMAKLLGALERSPPDILYAVGSKAWSIAGDLAQALNRPMLVDIWSIATAESAHQIGRQLPRGTAVAGYLAPSEGIAQALRTRVDPSLVALIPSGVPVPAQAHGVMLNPEAACLAILGRCRDVSAYQSLLGGLSRVLKQFRGVQLILELRGPGEHEIWREAERLELLGAVSAIGSASLYRDLLMGSDAIVMPEAGGEVRSIMLECMASGVPVIAREDKSLYPKGENDFTMEVVSAGSDAWAITLSRLLQEPEWSRSLGQQGRAKVQSEHRSSRHAEQMSSLLDLVSTGGTMQFQTA